jgi:hypothetical protein
MQGVTRRHQTPTLAGPSRNARYRHAKTHRHASDQLPTNDQANLATISDHDDT